MFWSSILHTYPPLLSQLHGLHLTYLPLTPLTVAAQKVRYRVRHFGRVFTFPVVSAKILIPGVVIGHLDGARSAIFQGFDGFDTRKSQKFFANLLTYPPALRAACGRPLTYLPLTLTSHPTYLSRDRTKRWLGGEERGSMQQQRRRPHKCPARGGRDRALEAMGPLCLFVGRGKIHQFY